MSYVYILFIYLFASFTAQHCLYDVAQPIKRSKEIPKNTNKHKCNVREPLKNIALYMEKRAENNVPSLIDC